MYQSLECDTHSAAVDGADACVEAVIDAGEHYVGPAAIEQLVQNQF